ncbi:MAG: dethiobiotin synthase [Planctomycetales bacterium]|nr:dethiobiotin synthase [Planctomycetales bacterium]
MGTDTAVGKTHQACLLARALRAEGRGVAAYKPVASGSAPPGQSDAELLWAASGSAEPLHRTCPQSFHAPLAPPLAAALEQRQVDEELLASGAVWWQQRCEFLIVEGAGGALSPISESSTVLDLACRLQLPVVLIAANRLGVVNHTLLSLQAILARGLPVLGVVLNDLPPASQDVSPDSNAGLLRSFAPASIPLVHSIEELWQPSGLDAH